MAAPASAPAATEVTTHLVAADAHVVASAPATRLGKAQVMQVDRATRARGYLRFGIRHLGGPVQRAELRLGYTARRPVVLEVRRTGATWSERTLSWRSAPSVGPAVVRRRLSGDGTARIDVTSLVRANGTVTLALTTRRGRLLVSTRERAGGAPRLVLESLEQDAQPAAPLRTALYDAGYPERWPSRTAHTPSLGRYESTAATTIASHLRALAHANVEVAAVRWDRRRGPLDRRLSSLLEATDQRPLRWIVRHTGELSGDPSVRRLAADLRAIDLGHGRHPAYGRLGGRPVVLVEGRPDDGCEMYDRWRRANDAGLHLVISQVRGRCRSQPSDRWPGARDRRFARAGRAIVVSPGGRRLGRDVGAFRSAVRRMIAARPRWEIVSSFNDWRAQTAVEGAEQWRSLSGFGSYLDVLHDPATSPAPLRPGEAMIAAAGDIACDRHSQPTATTCRQMATSDLLVGRSYDAVLALGDTQYDHGSHEDFAASWHPSWGRLGRLVRPAVGNHEYHTPGAAGYFDYFNGAGAVDGPAGRRGKGWYAFDAGNWRLIALNSNCEHVDGCGPGSEQLLWLQDELARNPRRCVLAYFHHPVFSSGRHGGSSKVRPIFGALYEAGAEVVLTGHDHEYERFAPLSPGGEVDAAAGIRQWVVGTGGAGLRPFETIQPHSEVRSSDAMGVLELKLRADGYDWRFVPAEGDSLSDTGSGSCH